MIYPWHQRAWHNITAHWQQLPHAWLLLGKAHTGKTAFAQHFAQALLCENPSVQHEPCGVCASCHLFAQHSHPDFYTISPELPTGETPNARRMLQIKIDAIRAILEPLNQSSVRGGRRVVLLNPADSMNLQASNALLKILEEPPNSVVFLLIARHRDSVLPTIKSRCRLLLLPAPTQEVALKFLHDKSWTNAENLLAFHSGAPLFERDETQEALREQLTQCLVQPRLLAILDYAAELDKQKRPLAELLDGLQKWLIDISLIQQKISPMYFPQCKKDMVLLSSKINPVALFTLLKRIQTLHPYGYHSLNVKIQTESLLTEYLSAVYNKTA